MINQQISRLPGGVITGRLTGNSVAFTARMAHPGTELPAGNYIIHEPVNDPVYGMIAHVTTESAKLGSAAGNPEHHHHFHHHHFGIASQVSPTTGAFLLSDRPIPGQNSIVVTLGFADLMDALQNGGEVSVSVV